MPDAATVGRWLIFAGLGLLVVGALLLLLSRAGLPLGRLPGDLRFQVGGLSCFVPLATTLLLSILLTVILNIVLRLLHR